MPWKRSNGKPLVRRALRQPEDVLHLAKESVCRYDRAAGIVDDVNRGAGKPVCRIAVTVGAV